MQLKNGQREKIMNCFAEPPVTLQAGSKVHILNSSVLTNRPNRAAVSSAATWNLEAGLQPL
jgi:hypothetical protein